MASSFSTFNLLQPFLRSAGQRKSDGSTSPRYTSSPRTFRMSLIPISVNKTQLITYLNGLSYDRKGCGDSLDQSTNLHGVSLVPRDTWKAATVTFVEEPYKFKDCLPGHHIEIALRIAGVDTVDISVDVDFYSITPLYSPSEVEPSVE